ncbi:glycosyltransferase [Vibrio parahaemolyticus]|nr:glycosyltransferase [Vibrio parahaemolyticus]
MGDIKVSVCVITYNHEMYISECLASLVSQKTSFKYEIVIRDDCSQDSTLSIIKDYKEKYPELIRLLDSSENVGGSKNSMMVFSAAEGEYISWCEGDDFFYQ